MKTTVDRLLGHVSARVRTERERHGWTQSELAERADLSRRMLAGIESEASNVSLATLDRIANALGISFADLIREGAPTADDDPMVVWRGEQKGSEALLLQNSPASRIVEFWEWTLAPKQRYQAHPDRKGMKHIIYVVSGALTIEFARKRRRIAARNSILFASDTRFSYVNLERKPTRFVLNVIE